MNFLLLNDNWSARQAEPLQPHSSIYNLHDLHVPNKVLAMPAPVTATAVNWLKTRRETNKEIEKNMLKYT